MIYLLVPTGNPEWDDMRLFTTFSAIEQVVAKGIEERRERRENERWCFVIAYDGEDELRPLWGYTIYDGYLQRCAITQSLSESSLQRQLARSRENRGREELP
jgi:hypothetical protein